ncbi:MAG: endonuclease III [Candidatus Eiseniibacteriota bacterium]
MSAMLTRIAAALGRAPDELALTRVARERDPFAVLVACLISLRTKDEVTDTAAARLLEVAPDAERLARLPERRIARLIFPAGFYQTKARTLRALARTLLAEHGGRVPDSLETLLGFKGVGRKTANLVITQGFGKPGICVDTHVHRVSNRVGFVRTASPDETETVLRVRLPRRWWIPINDLLVSFGRTCCVPISPRCSECPVRMLCPRISVGRHR